MKISRFFEKSAKSVADRLKGEVYLSHGQVLILTFVFLALVMVLTTVTLGKTRYFLSFGSRSIAQETAINLAEAGIDFAIFKLNTAQNFTGETFLLGQGEGEVEVSVQTTGNTKEITATAYLPNKIASKNLKRTAKIRVKEVVPTEPSPFSQTAHVGKDGIFFGDNSPFSVETPEIEGDVKTLGSIDVEIVNSSFGKIQNIADSVRATGTIAPASRLDVSPGPKSPNDSTVGVLPSDADLLQKIAEAADAGNTCTNLDLSFEDKTLGDPFDPKSCSKITGNIAIDNGTLHLAGPVWVRGSVEMQTASRLQVANGKTASQWLRADQGFFTQTDAGIVLSPQGHFVGILSTRTTLFAVAASGYGQGAAFFVPNGSVQVHLFPASIRQEATVAVIAKHLRIREIGKIKWNQNLATAQFQTSPFTIWQPIRGTYQLAE